MAEYQKRTRRMRSTAKLRKVKGKSQPASVNPALKAFQKLMRKTLIKIKSFDARFILLPIGLILLVAISAATLWFFTNKNALDIYLGEVKIGAVKKSDDITPELLMADATAKLRDQLGANVEVKETVNITPVRASSKDLDSISYIVSELSKRFTYKIEAAVITVDGIEMAIVKNTDEVEAIKESIISQYVEEGSEIIEKGFVEELKTETRFVEKESIITNDTAYSILTAQRETNQSYTVAPGDSIWAISARLGITQEKIFEMNPGLDPAKPLKIGQELVITVPSPVLSVKTIEKVVLTEAAEATTEYHENPNERKSYSRVVQQGKDGQKEVTYHITRINGATQERTAISEEYITSPVPEIIEVGTR